MSNVGKSNQPKVTVTTQTQRTVVRQITEVETIRETTTVTRPASDRFVSTDRPTPPAIDRSRGPNLEPLARMALKSMESSVNSYQGWKVGKQMLEQMDKTAGGQNWAVKFGLIAAEASSNDHTDYNAIKAATRAIIDGRDHSDRDLAALAVTMMEKSVNSYQGWKVGRELAGFLETHTADPALRAHLAAAREAVEASSNDNTDYTTLIGAFRAVRDGQLNSRVEVSLAETGIKAMRSSVNSYQGMNVGKQYLQQIAQETQGQSWAARFGLRAMEASTNDNTDYNAAKAAMEAIAQHQDRSVQDQARLALRMMEQSVNSYQGWMVGRSLAEYMAKESHDPTVQAMAEATLTAVQASSNDTTDYNTLKEFFRGVAQL